MFNRIKEKQQQQPQQPQSSSAAATTTGTATTDDAAEDDDDYGVSNSQGSTSSVIIKPDPAIKTEFVKYFLSHPSTTFLMSPA
jgi:hypothetical protein